MANDHIGPGRLQEKGIARYAFAGKATLTVRANDQRFTYRITESEDGKLYFVNVLRNDGRYDYIGIVVKAQRTFRWTQGSKISQDAPSVQAFATLFRRFFSRNYDGIEVWHEGTCGRCGRQLTVPESIETGIGPVCAGRM